MNGCDISKGAHGEWCSTHRVWVLRDAAHVSGFIAKRDAEADALRTELAELKAQALRLAVRWEDLPPRDTDDMRWCAVELRRAFHLPPREVGP